MGDALKQWRSHLAITGDTASPQQDPGEAATEAVAEPVDEATADDSNAGQGEYEYMAEGEGRAEGEQQAMAPATEDQAKAIEALDQSGLPDQDADDITAAEAEAEMPLDDSSERLRAEQAMRAEAPAGQAPTGAQQEAKAQHAQQQQDLNGVRSEAQPQDDAVMDEAEEARIGVDDSYVSAQMQRASLSDGMADGLPDKDMVLAEGGLTREAAQQLRQDVELRVKAASEGTLQLDTSEHSAAYGQEVYHLSVHVCCSRESMHLSPHLLRKAGICQACPHMSLFLLMWQILDLLLLHTTLGVPHVQVCGRCLTLCC